MAEVNKAAEVKSELSDESGDVDSTEAINALILVYDATGKLTAYVSSAFSAQIEKKRADIAEKTLEQVVVKEEEEADVKDEPAHWNEVDTLPERYEPSPEKAAAREPPWRRDRSVAAAFVVSEDVHHEVKFKRKRTRRSRHVSPKRRRECRHDPYEG